MNNDNKRQKCETTIPEPPKNFRRVVTGPNEKHQSSIIRDSSTAPWILEPLPGLYFHEMWETSVPNSNQNPCELLDPPVVRENNLGPKDDSGTLFRIVDFPPDSVWTQTDVKEAFDRYGSLQSYDADKPSPTGDASPSLMMHTTQTTDYAICLNGEIYAVMQDGEVKLKQGDSLIQRGTSHGWSNKSKDRASVAFILVGAINYTSSP